MGRSLRCIPEVVPNIVRAIQGGRLPLHPTAPVQPLLRRQPGLCNDEMLLKRVIRQLPFLCFVRYIYPRNIPPPLATPSSAWTRLPARVPGGGSTHCSCPPECCEAAAVSALLLQVLLACFWGRSAFYHT